jgi:hypothetical protein
MKVKDWIKELQTADPEAELYYYEPDWGYHLSIPNIQKQKLIVYTDYKRKFFYLDNGLVKGTPIGEQYILQILP